MITRLTVIFVLAGLLWAGAQDSPADSSAAPAPSRVKLFIDKIEVEGRLEKPQAVFILPGQTPEIDDIVIERSFIKELFRPVEKRTTVETVYRPTDARFRKDVLEW